MSVFTPVTPEMLAPFLAVRDVGTLQTLQGISAGVTNTNYFAATPGARPEMRALPSTAQAIP
jgi:homoserine kinase type II